MVPSYLKVFGGCFSVFGVWLAVSHMAFNIDIKDIDLASPRDTVSCADTWPRLSGGWLQWFQYDVHPSRMFGKVHRTTQNCSNVNMSLTSLDDFRAGYPYVFSNKSAFPAILAWAIAACVFSGSLAIWVLIHDISLISYNWPHIFIQKYSEEKFEAAFEAERTRMRRHLWTILDIQGVKKNFPCCWSIWQSIVACGCSKVCCPCPGDGGLPRCILAYTLSIITFVAVVCPWVALLGLYDCLRWVFLYCCCKKVDYEPQRLSRLVVFSVCCMSSALYLVISIDIFGYVLQRSKRESNLFAVVWQQDKSECGCHYPLHQSKYIRVMLEMIGNTLLFIGMGTRTLKGLRCSIWANLITCSFSVPIAVWPVQWKHQNEFIQHRDHQANFVQPVQAEPAFDPFALLDEQPNSSGTNLTIEPRVESTCQAGREKINRKEDIECCGFPWKLLGNGATTQEDDLSEGLLA